MGAVDWSRRGCWHGVIAAQIRQRAVARKDIELELSTKPGWHNTAAAGTIDRFLSATAHAADKNVASCFLTAHMRASQHLWIHDIDWLASRVRDDLVEYL